MTYHFIRMNRQEEKEIRLPKFLWRFGDHLELRPRSLDELSEKLNSVDPRLLFSHLAA